MSANPQALVRMYEQLKAKRQEIDADVQAIASYVMPQKATIQERKTAGVESWTDALYDMTAQEANMVLAAGLMSTATPTSSRWAQLAYPGRYIKGQRVSSRVKGWMQGATEEIMDEIARSNFYTELHESHLDRNGLGTCFLFMEEGKRNFFNFQSINFGQYVIAEDAEGYVDTAFREYRLTARQAVQEFGLEALPEGIRECYAAGNAGGDGKDANKEWVFIHCIYPRLDRDVDKLDNANKEFASVTLCKDPLHLVKESGYDEFPGAVSRYLKWPGTTWGFGPGFIVLPPARQVNFIERQMDALAEKAAFPPVLVPSNLIGQVDPRAAGQTVFDENFPQALPREWMTQGRYDIGKDRVMEKQKAIRAAFHNDLFQMFAAIERDMTAFEAMQRANEKLDLISPSFTRMANELLSPIILRAFRMKLRAGALPQPPEELLEMLPGNRVALKEPKVTYVSKLALAIRASENRAFIELQQILAGPAEIQPDILDNFDMDKVARGVADNIGLPAEWQRDEQQVAGMRAARAQAQQEAAMVEQAQGVAKAAKDVSGASSEVRNRLGALAGQN